MTNTINISGLPPRAPQAPAPAAGAPVQADSSANAAPTKSSGSTTDAALSPRFVVDAISGVLITEYNTAGIESQIPSAAAVAYLRAGLDQQGLPKEGVKSPHKDAQTNSSDFYA